MKKLFINFIAIFVAVLPLTVKADDAERHALRQTKFDELAKARTATDSLRLMYDIFDLTDNQEKRGERALEIMKLANSINDSLAVYDMLRQASQSYSLDDDKFKWLIAEASRMPYGDNRRETETFMKIQRFSRKMQKLNADERRKLFEQRLDQFKQDTQVDRWRRIEVLFTLCIYLTNTTNSPMLTSYLDQLDKLIDALPNKSLPLRNLFSVNAAMVYSSVGNRDAAIKADKNLLQQIDAMEADYAAKGRKYRNFVRNKYTIYRRLLSNGKSLTPEEIETYYSAINRLMHDHKEVKETEDLVKLTDPYYYMAKKDYAKALPLLQQALDVKNNNPRRYQLLGMLVEAAKQTNNTEVLVPAIEEYMQLLERRVTDAEKDRIIEYQVLHDIDNLQSSKNQLEKRNQQLQIEMSRTGRFITYGIFLALLVVVVVLIFAYLRARSIGERIAEANRLLTDERDKLRRTQQELIAARDNADIANRKKTEFLHNVSHEISGPTQAIVGYSQLIIDSVDDKNRRYLQRFSDIIDINARLLQAQVNDLLDAAELENYNVSLKMRSVDMSQLADMAADSVADRVKPDVKLVVKPMTQEDADLSIVTDAARTEQVLLKLLSNATKFTDKGTITLSYGRCGDKVIYAVEDTGPGIPAEKADAVFERFEKLSNYAGGLGLGLHIARLVAQLLDGNVYLDTTYNQGARFVFELPYEKPKK